MYFALLIKIMAEKDLSGEDILKHIDEKLYGLESDSSVSIFYKQENSAMDVHEPVFRNKLPDSYSKKIKRTHSIETKGLAYKPWNI